MTGRGPLTDTTTQSSRLVLVTGATGYVRSRHAVGDILRESGVPTVEFRASVIIGPGSLSFELIRSLVTRLPVMVVPKWERVEAQPIAIDDVLAYLVEAIELPLSGSTIYPSPQGIPIPSSPGSAKRHPGYRTTSPNPSLKGMHNPQSQTYRSSYATPCRSRNRRNSS